MGKLEIIELRAISVPEQSRCLKTAVITTRGGTMAQTVTETDSATDGGCSKKKKNLKRF